MRCGKYNTNKITYKHIKLSDKYVYLELTLIEFLDYNVTAKIIVQIAGRA